MAPWETDTARRRRLEEERYRQVTGREPARLPEDHPDAWQWEYAGSKADREELLERLALHEEDEPVVIEGQEEMF